MTTAKITRNGQVTIPKQLREKLFLQEGNILLFSEEKGRIFISPLQTVNNKNNTEKETENNQLALKNSLKKKVQAQFDDSFSSNYFYSDEEALEVANKEISLSRSKK
jgi:AbrB family looped-hinge helix DNA binding protein